MTVLVTLDPHFTERVTGDPSFVVTVLDSDPERPDLGPDEGLRYERKVK